MIEFRNIKISNRHRQEKKNRQKQKFNHMTPQKYLDSQSTYRTVDRLEKKFGYDYEFENSKTLKYMKQEFLDRTVSYLGKGEWTKKLGRKDKFERNMQLGKPLKKNPLIKVFNKLECKLQTANKFFAFKVIKKQFS